MNTAESALGPVPVPLSLVRRVIHSDPSLAITEEQKGGSGDHVVVRHYTTDGKQVTFQEDGANVVATAVSIAFVEMTLYNGEVDATYSFEKQ